MSIRKFQVRSTCLSCGTRITGTAVALVTGDKRGRPPGQSVPTPRVMPKQHDSRHTVRQLRYAGPLSQLKTKLAKKAPTGAKCVEAKRATWAAAEPPYSLPGEARKPQPCSTEQHGVSRDDAIE